MSVRSSQPARGVALEVIRAVTDDGAYANLLLPARIRAARLGPADAGLATELAYGTLRRRGYYDRVIEIAARRAIARIDPPVLDVLRMGAHQLLAMRVPAHAAVDESVESVRRIGSRAASGFVNAVLRRIAGTTTAEWDRRLSAGLNGLARAAALSAHPEWIASAFADSLRAEGREGELGQLLDSDNVPPRVAVVALPGLADPSELGEPGSASPLAAILAGGDPADVDAIRAGRARVQDEGSQLAALALSRARPIRPRERWLDLCAGPGGKTALLAAEASAAGARLTATELLPARADLVRRAVAPLADPPEVLTLDGRTAGERWPRTFDRILLDAPCTGLGALRRRPEARWRKSPDDVPELAELQVRLLDAAVAALRPGGLLAYVTCSPHPAETREVVEAALDRHPGLMSVDTPAALQRIAVRPLDLGPGPAAQLWPHRTGTDAMHIRLLTLDEAPAAPAAPGRDGAAQ